MEIVTTSAKETKDLGAKLARSLKGGDVLALYGDLGSGKTTFTQGLAQALGIKQRIVSPTFVIYKKYKILNHIDCYRLENSDDLTGIDLDEIMGDPTAITIIEWPERIESLLPKDAVKIRFETVDEKTRRIVVERFIRES